MKWVEVRESTHCRIIWKYESTVEGLRCYTLCESTGIQMSFSFCIAMSFCIRAFNDVIFECRSSKVKALCYKSIGVANFYAAKGPHSRAPENLVYCLSEFLRNTLKALCLSHDLPFRWRRALLEGARRRVSEILLVGGSSAMVTALKGFVLRGAENMLRTEGIRPRLHESAFGSAFALICATELFSYYSEKVRSASASVSLNDRHAVRIKVGEVETFEGRLELFSASALENAEESVGEEGDGLPSMADIRAQCRRACAEYKRTEHDSAVERRLHSYRERNNEILNLLSGEGCWSHLNAVNHYIDELEGVRLSFCSDTVEHAEISYLLGSIFDAMNNEQKALLFFRECLQYSFDPVVGDPKPWYLKAKRYVNIYDEKVENEEQMRRTEEEEQLLREIEAPLSEVQQEFKRATELSTEQNKIQFYDFLAEKYMEDNTPSRYVQYQRARSADMKVRLLLLLFHPDRNTNATPATQRLYSEITKLINTL